MSANAIKRYAMLMNYFVAVFYVVIGTFDSLVTFIGMLPVPARGSHADERESGLCEYSFWILAVLGVFKLRRQDKDRTAYRTMTWNPIIFCIVSSCLILRGIITNPAQGAGIAMLCLVCWATYRYRGLGERGNGT